jgi:hypothetical protein
MKAQAVSPIFYSMALSALFIGEFTAADWRGAARQQFSKQWRAR